MEPTKVVVLDRGNNTTSTINLHGATVVSWRVINQEQLFVCKQAVFDGRKPIRGGITFGFPQYGYWAFGPRHGFARVNRWTLEKEPQRLLNGDIEAVFSLADNEFTRSMWNFDFRLYYRLTLREKELHLHISVKNVSKSLKFGFNLLLHTDLKVPDVRLCVLNGFQGCTYIDKNRKDEIVEETSDLLTLTESTYRKYKNTAPKHKITNVVGNHTMLIEKINLPDTVVFNPGSTKSEFSPFADNEYLNMVSLQAGNAFTKCMLHPGETYEAGLILQVFFQYFN